MTLQKQKSNKEQTSKSMPIQHKRLKDLIVEMTRGIFARSPESEDVPTIEMINIKDLSDGKVDIRSLEKRDCTSIKDYSRAAVKRGDVIIAIKGSSFKAAVFNDDADNHVISSNLIALRLNKTILPEILAAYLNSPDGQQNLLSIAKGATIPSINPNDLRELLIPIISDNDQKIMKEYLEASDRYLSMLKEEETLVRKMRNNIISSSFGVTG